MDSSKTSLGFLVLLSMVLLSGTSSDPHSLSYNFTIDPRPRDNQLWCEVQGEVDQKVFLSYDCGTAQIKYMSPLGEEVKNMSAWEAQTVTLRDTGDLLQGQMPDGTPENHTDKVRSGPLILQARMTCWREDNGHTSASWEFGFNGQLCLLFDSENGHCTVVHPGGRWMKEKWENDRAVTDFFRMVSMGDCPAWLQAFLVRWEKMLKTSAPSTTVPTTVQPTAPASNHITKIILVVLAVFVIISIVAWILDEKRRRCSQEARQVLCCPEESVFPWLPLFSWVHFRGKR
ncbi:UL16-binding protein 2-like isoform X1 [Ovis canadensis]|uniref:UL16-binding protein 2-like isoform X1 n=1 Tax=Ovis canadensis TaxID=37174 RepID=UPI0037378E43